MTAPLQVDVLREASRSFREYSQGHGAGSAVLLALMALALAGLLLYAFLSGRRRVIGRRLFLRLAKASALDKAELAFLLDVARRASPENPSSLFLRRSLFEGVVAELPGADASLVASVRRKVYSP
jgi:hypothetical protein